MYLNGCVAQLGRAAVSKTVCRRFKSFRTRKHEKQRFVVAIYKYSKKFGKTVGDIDWPSFSEIVKVGFMVTGVILAFALPLYSIDVAAIYIFDFFRKIIWFLLDLL